MARSRSVLSAAVALAMLAFAAASEAAKVSAPAAAVLPGVPATAPAAAVRSYSMSFKQLGATYPLQLRGVQGLGGVPFSVRADEVVVGAKLKLKYAYSPALLSNISHINVRVNGEVAGTIAVPREQAGTDLEQDIAIPPRLITDFNRIDLELIGHYTLECEDPLHSSLWTSISNQSSITLDVTPVALPDDLALLPGPLFDRRDVRSLNLPFIFMAPPVPSTLEAAGAVSSWFGALAGYRGAKFPAAIGTLPASGSAVVFVVGSDGLPGVDLPAPAGPTLAMVTNPNDPVSKLLVVMGRDAAELRTAATALAVGGPALSGRMATVTGMKEIEARKPYDAPAWLRSDRPVRFGEIADQRALNVSGYTPDTVRINFRAPPDLFAWREKGIPVDLRYRYTPRPTADKSTLNINVNDQYLRAYPLRAANHDSPSVIDALLPTPEDGTVMAHERLRVPLFLLPAQSQLQFHYYYDYVKQGFCKDVMLDNVRGAIDADSTIDISGFSHFLAMPDLAAFGNSGFPFTRMADLSETAVVMPDKGDLPEWSAYLNLMGLMGRSSGYPATGVLVTPASLVEKVSGKDLLVISSGADQPLLQRWERDLPAAVTPTARRFPLSDLAYRVLGWWDGRQQEQPVDRREELSYTGSGPQAVISGFESPLSGGRSVVMVSADQPEALDGAVNALLDQDLLKHVHGSAVVVRGQQVSSLVSEQTYHVGRLDPLTWIQWFLSRHPLVLVVVGLVAAALLAVVMYLALRARARLRLRSNA
ncbi:cellulose biosynthesis cyclic di-GMP-binding regulatory protein BcsB [Xylophilus sp. GW821-FHT01B05]